MKYLMKMIIPLGAALLLFGLAACGNAPYERDLPRLPIQEDDPYVTVLTMAWWGSATRHERTLEVIAQFEAQNPGIRIEAEYFDFDGYFTALRARIASGDMWDIFQQGGTYADFRDVILPLNDLIDGGYIDISNADAEYIRLTTCTLTNEILGISLGLNSWGIAFDAEIFREVGLPMPHPGWTWTEFSNAALTINEQLGIWGVGSFPQEGTALSQYLLQTGESFFHPQYLHRLGIQSPQPMVSFLEMMAALVQRGATPSPAEALFIPNIEYDPLVTRRAGMSYIPSNLMIALTNAAFEIDPNRELLMTMLPGQEHGGATALGSAMKFCIYSGTQHQEYAARFICFFVNDIDANLVLLGERGVPIMSHVRDAIEDRGDCPAAAATSGFVSDITYVLEAVMQQPPTGIAGGGAGNPARSRVEHYMGTIIERVVLGLMTPEEGAQAIFDFGLEAVAEFAPD